MEMQACYLDIKIHFNVPFKNKGCIVDACLGCPSCKKGNEQYCHSRSTMTYNAECAKHGRISTDSGYTYGGYSGKISVNKAFIIQVPKDYPLECAGPIFCAGITTYSPLSHWGALNGGKRVGVIGIGGLGQMGVRQAAAMGNIVTAISTSPNKEKVAKEIGATHFIVSKDEEQMKKAHGSLDLIINTVSVSHQASTYMPLLAQDGTMVMLGVAPEPHKVSSLKRPFQSWNCS